MPVTLPKYPPRRNIVKPQCYELRKDSPRFDTTSNINATIATSMNLDSENRKESTSIAVTTRKNRALTLAQTRSSQRIDRSALLNANLSSSHERFKEGSEIAFMILLFERINFNNGSLAIS